MKLDKKSSPLLFVSVFFSLVIAIETLSILFLNSGKFIYTLDDPYIHLALANKIGQGHYGINNQEFSSPSSSILWPFILTPFSNFELLPLFINFLCAAVTLFFFYKILKVAIGDEQNPLRTKLQSVILLSLVLATNLIGLIFTGMEHSLQTLLSVIIIYGLILEVETGKLKHWLLVALVLAPLIRYECLAISFPAFVYLLKRDYSKQVTIYASVLIFLLSSFSFFLISLGLKPLPSSVFAKSSLFSSNTLLSALGAKLYTSLMVKRQGVLLSVGALSLLSYAFTLHNPRKQLFAVLAACSILIHFLAGKFGAYHRYEIYIWTYALLAIVYLSAPTLCRFLEKKSPHFVVVLAAGSLPILLAGLPYVIGLATLPIASNNIYEQQYQMHRFATDFYNKPIAVNDLGLCSYKNPNYVLDLFGLASPQALQYRIQKENNHWLGAMTQQSNIELVMIYDTWFDHIPDHWVRLGNLELSKKCISPADREVSFYATNPKAAEDIEKQLRLFIPTLPTGVRFELLSSNRDHLNPSRQ